MTQLTRREFIELGAGALTVNALVQQLEALARPTARIRFGYAAITWSGKDAQAIDDIASLGFPGIQLRSNILPEYQSQPRALASLLANRRLTFVAFSSGEVSVDPAQRAKMIDDHVARAKFVRDAGGLYLQLTDQRPRGRAVNDDDIARLADTMSEIGRRSAELGVSVGYHPHMGAIGEGPEAIDRILAATDSRAVKLLLDVAHYQQGGGDPIAAIRRYRDRLLMLHIKDVESPSPGGAPGSYRFVELGKGRVDLKAVFAALADVGFDGWAVVELDQVPDVSRTPKESAAANKQWLETAGWRVEG